MKTFEEFLGEGNVRHGSFAYHVNMADALKDAPERKAHHMAQAASKLAAMAGLSGSKSSADHTALKKYNSLK